MKESSGLLIVKDNKILLGHPTNHKWYDSYSIPKGEIEPNESRLDAAIRETFEEVGLEIHPKMIEPTEYVVNYTNKSGTIYKKVYYYIAKIDYENDILPKEQLQLEEIDWAGFLDYEEAEKRIFWRFKDILKHIK